MFIEKIENRFDEVFSELDNINVWIKSNPFDLKSKFLISYSIIRTCGCIELGFKEIIFQYLSTNATNDTIKYLEYSIIDSSDNPSTNKISKILEHFNNKKKESFDNELLSNQILKSDLNSLVNLRNDIAHGRTNNVSINTVVNYFNSAVQVLKILDLVLQ